MRTLKMSLLIFLVINRPAFAGQADENRTAWMTTQDPQPQGIPGLFSSWLCTSRTG